MKKLMILTTILMALGISTACADNDKPIAVTQLPQKAQGRSVAGRVSCRGKLPAGYKRRKVLCYDLRRRGSRLFLSRRGA